MKIYVYTPLNSCFQNKEILDMNNYYFDYGNYEVNNKDKVIVKDMLNSALFRIFYNITIFIKMYYGSSDDSYDDLLRERKNIKRKNKNVTGIIFTPIFYKNKEIEFKLLECNENTILKIYRVKNGKNFYYEIYEGKVEVIYNGKKRK